MNFKWIGLLLSMTTAYAGESKSPDKHSDLKKVIDEQAIYVETSQTGIKLSGYVDAGYTYNFTGPRTLVVPRGANDGAAAGEAKGDFNLNNLKLVLEKELPEHPISHQISGRSHVHHDHSDEWASGFRVDLNLGEDAHSSIGSTATDGASAVWLQQAYVQFRAPVGNGIDFQVGKWGGFMGFEAPERPANFNITQGLAQSLVEPGENVGVVSIYPVNDLLTLKFGVANADWNNADSVSLSGGAGDDSVLLTGAAVLENQGRNATLTNAFVYNPKGGTGVLANATPAGAATQVANDGPAFVWNQVGTWMPVCFKEKLMLAYSGVFGFYDDYAHASFGTPPREYNETYYGIGTYAKYQFTSLFSLASRVDYIRCNDGAKFGTVGSAMTPTDAFGKNSEAFALTTTAGFNLDQNLLFRLEYRVDWTHVNDPSGAASANGDATSAHLAAAQVVYSF